MTRPTRAGPATAPGPRFCRALGLLIALGMPSCRDDPTVTATLPRAQVARSAEQAREALAGNDALVGFERVERLAPPFLIVYLSKPPPDPDTGKRLDGHMRLLRAWHAYFAQRWSEPLGLTTGELIPIALFRTDDEFKTFTRARGLRLGLDVGGLVDATLDWALVRDDLENTESMIIHEVTHLMHSRARKRLGGTAAYTRPIWLAEGWAQYDAVVDSSDDRFAFGQDSSRFRELLAGAEGVPPMPLPPLRLLVRCPRLADWERMYRDWTRKVNPGFEEWLVRGEIQGVFRKWASDVLYLQSWAFFRFLAERTNTRTSLAAFMKAALRAPPEADHWDVAFGREFGIRADEDWRALQRRFDRFLRDGG